MPWEVYLRSVFVQRNCQRSFKKKMANEASCNDFCSVEKLLRKFQQSFNREFTLYIRHRRSSNCGEMFADSSGKFQVNVRRQVRVRFNLSNGRQKGQAQWIYIRWLRGCCWAAKSLTRSQSGWRQKALPNKTLDKFKSFQSIARTSRFAKRDSNALICSGTASICSDSKMLTTRQRS